MHAAKSLTWKRKKQSCITFTVLVHLLCVGPTEAVHSPLWWISLCMTVKHQCKVTVSQLQRKLLLSEAHNKAWHLLLTFQMDEPFSTFTLLQLCCRYPNITRTTNKKDSTIEEHSRRLSDVSNAFYAYELCLQFTLVYVSSNDCV